MAYFDFYDFYDSLKQAIQAYTRPEEREAFLKECSRRVAERLGLLRNEAPQEEAAIWQVIADRTWEDRYRAIKDESKFKTPFRFSMGKDEPPEGEAQQISLKDFLEKAGKFAGVNIHVAPQFDNITRSYWHMDESLKQLGLRFGGILLIAGDHAAFAPVTLYLEYVSGIDDILRHSSTNPLLGRLLQALANGTASLHGRVGNPHDQRKPIEAAWTASDWEFDVRSNFMRGGAPPITIYGCRVVPSGQSKDESPPEAPPQRS